MKTFTTKQRSVEKQAVEIHTRREEPIERMLVPFQKFFHAEVTGGILLFTCTLAALIWANSPWVESYQNLWQMQVTAGVGNFVLEKPLILWINDALMAVFFFVVGLEIKREILVGELASPRQAALPIMAALGGMLVPASIYLIFNAGSHEIRGWGVPMATDIAFALGVLALLGKRIPVSVKIFLTAVAIIDDIGAALVIALFYTDTIFWWSLGIGGGFLLVMLIANMIGIRSTLPYALLGIGLWIAFLKSGVHPTLAGIIAAMTIPARFRIDSDEFVRSSRTFIDDFEKAGKLGTNILTNKEQRGALFALELACEQAQTPLQKLEHALHPWVSFAIIPVFALANAGVQLDTNLGSRLTDCVALGVAGGLIFGKQIGITLFSWLAFKSKIVMMPKGMSWRHIYGISCLCGIGFTMSIFIANLAFKQSSQLEVAKIGVLAASLISGISGWLILRRSSRID